MIATHLWADDLTGAAELADAVRRRTGHARIALAPARVPASPATEDDRTVIDLDARHLSFDDAYRRLDDALSAIPSTDRVAYKIDSQLHGPIAAYVAAFHAHGRRPAFCAANPRTGRVTVGGAHRVPGPTGTVVTAVRSVVGDAAAVLLLDAADDDGLQRAAHAAAAVDAIGSAAFLDAWLTERSRSLDGSDDAAAPAPDVSAPALDASVPHRLLVIAGSTEPIVDAQLAALSTGDTTAMADAAITIDGSTHDLDAATVLAAIGRRPVTALRITPERLDAVAATLAHVIDATPPSDVALLLTGGHTARRVLDHARITALRAAPSTAPGIASFVDPSGRRIFTKPGSYGTATSIRLLAQSVLATTHLEPR